MYPRIPWELVVDPLGFRAAHFGNRCNRLLHASSDGKHLYLLQVEVKENNDINTARAVCTYVFGT
jgi:hypothetical protein